jgi:hypothetical protein
MRFWWWRNQAYHVAITVNQHQYERISFLSKLVKCGELEAGAGLYLVFGKPLVLLTSLPDFFIIALESPVVLNDVCILL